jgi:hypothetical protein
MAKRHGGKRRLKGASKKAKRGLRRGMHAIGRKGKSHGLEHLFGRKEHRSGRRKTRRK